MDTPRSVAIVSKPGKPELAQVVPNLLAWFTARSYKIVVDTETQPFASGLQVVSREDLGSLALDFVIVLGGDGTLLSAARSVAKSGIPVLGVNLGSLGFLTEVQVDELYPTLEAIHNGERAVEDRTMVHCEILRDGVCVASYEALNDIVVGKATIARLNHCDVFVDNNFVSGYKADSLIVSSPTGSTAYCLAAGGPILMPSVAAFVITPVSAHSLTHRPLVVPDTSEIAIVVMTGSEEAYLSIDGQLGMPLFDEDRIICRKSASTVKLLRVQRTFFDILRSKLKWGQR